VTITLAHEYLTVHEAATILRVSVPTIYRRCADGRLPHIRVGGDDGPIRVLASAVIPEGPLLERRETPVLPPVSQGQSSSRAHGGEAA
jgi:excisionase family DNA binding protein